MNNPGNDHSAEGNMPSPTEFERFGPLRKAFILLIAAAGVLVVLYQIGAFEKYSTDFSDWKERNGPKTASSGKEEKIVKALKNFADAQKIHKNKYGTYALHPELLVGLGRVGQDTGLSISPKLIFEGYYFAGLKKQAHGYVDLNKGFLLVAIPSNYGQSGQDTYVIGPTAKVFRKDVGAEQVSDASQIDGSWKQIQ